jgi:4-hydroxybenzoate polyprenyltransferase
MRLWPYILALRPQQWLKNIILFSAIFFNGRLFDVELLSLSAWGFLIFCCVSSASYLINDVVDLPLDRQHPTKRFRPLASGLISVRPAIILAIILAMLGVGGGFLLKPSLGILVILFILLHLFYSLSFKKYAILDIFTIALSFMIRVMASEIITGYHLSIWLFLTIFFVALFIASSKRHSELIKRGTAGRPTLFQYQERLLNFYVSTFATASILSYSLFTYLFPTLKHDSWLGQTLLDFNLPKMVERKWLVFTIPLIVFGITRYAQLVYVGKEGERPEKLITTDIWLVTSIALWGTMMFIFLYW